jgi:hypothetical protein
MGLEQEGTSRNPKNGTGTRRNLQEAQEWALNKNEPPGIPSKTGEASKTGILGLEQQ